MHPNLLAYSDYELFESGQDLEKYRESKLDSVNRQLTSVIDNRYIDDDEQLQLGKNVFLQIIGKPSKLETAQYRFVFANNDGTDQRILVDNALNTISISIPKLMEARDE